MNSACRTKTSVEDSTRDLAASYRESGQWQQAVKLCLNAADISSRRTSGRGFEHVQPLDSIASEIAAKISAHGRAKAIGRNGPRVSLALTSRDKLFSRTTPKYS